MFVPQTITIPSLFHILLPCSLNLSLFQMFQLSKKLFIRVLAKNKQPEAAGKCDSHAPVLQRSRTHQ